MTQTNLEKWNFYLKDATAPQAYIDMGFYFMISAALQRRVWFGSYEMPLFLNIYAILVGDPGIGKGLVIRPVNDILKSFKFKVRGADEVAKIEESLTLLDEAATNHPDTGISLNLKSMLKNAPPSDEIKSSAPLFHLPCTADSTTFESLVREQATAYRRMSIGKKDKFAPNGVYTHSSMYMLLEEMGSFFKKNHENLIRYLMQAFDCNDYHHKTKTQGEDYVKKCCLSILAGCTPTFMAESFNAKVIDEGFSSRALYVFANAPRFDRFEVAGRSPEQIQAFEDVRVHVGKLIKLYGNVKYSPAAYEFMKHYVEHIIPTTRGNVDPKLIPYYARKRVHLQKMTGLFHFADNIDMEVSLESCQKAVAYLDILEKSMFYALQLRGKTPLNKNAKEILDYISKQSTPPTLNQLWKRFSDSLLEPELKEAIRFLLATNQLKKDIAKGTYSLPPKPPTSNP